MRSCGWTLGDFWHVVFAPTRYERVMERDVEKDVSQAQFVDTLRRLADALEAGEAFRIQVAGKRFTVPGDASLVIEHEADDGKQELALEMQWSE